MVKAFEIIKHGLLKKLLINYISNLDQKVYFGLENICVGNGIVAEENKIRRLLANKF